jgi:outer membrane protein assembly factor BamB
MLRVVGFVVALVLLVAGWLAVGPWVAAVLLVALLVPAGRRRMRPNRWLLGGLAGLVAIGVGVVVALPDGRLPLPPGGGLLVTSSYDGHAVEPQPIALSVPQHPALASNGASTMHDDGWATDSYQGPGPLGRDPEVTSSWFGLEECATLAFDPDGRLVALCGNRSGPVMHVLDPETMRPLETLDLPDREKSDKRPWEDLCGGAYFYLDARARAVVATTDRRVLTIDSSDLKEVDEVDLGHVVPDDDCLVALLPDWDGNTWYVTQDGRVGVAGGASDPTPLELGGEIANSIAADDTGVYLVTTDALVKVALDGQRQPEVVWQTSYDHGSEQKPGQLSAGSGTTPTVLPSGLVAITDNADPQMHVQFYDVLDGSLVCEAAVFGKGESASDNSLVAVGDASVVVENNYGYTAPWTTMVGRSTPGGLARVDADPATGECTVGWESDVIAPTSVAKVSLATGLVYAYTTKASWWGVSAWYLTAIDARTGETAWSVRTGTGTLFNNHYSAVTLGPDGSAYVATLGGMVRVRDR